MWPLVHSGFTSAQKSFWLNQGLEPATAWFPLKRITSVPSYTKSAHKRAQKVDP